MNAVGSFTSDLSDVIGNLLVFTVCIWVVFRPIAQLRSSNRRGTASDRTLGEVDKHEAPGLFALQIAGLMLLTIVAAAIAILAFAAILRQLFYVL